MIVLHIGEQSQHLKRLSKSHIIRQTPSKTIFIQKFQPLKSILLIRSKIGFHSFWQIKYFHLLKMDQPRFFFFYFSTDICLSIDLQILINNIEIKFEKLYLNL